MFANDKASSFIRKQIVFTQEQIAFTEAQYLSALLYKFRFQMQNLLTCVDILYSHENTHERNITPPSQQWLVALQMHTNLWMCPCELKCHILSLIYFIGFPCLFDYPVTVCFSPRLRPFTLSLLNTTCTSTCMTGRAQACSLGHCGTFIRNVFYQCF